MKRPLQKHTSSAFLCICRFDDWNFSYTATLATKTFRSLPPWRVILKRFFEPCQCILDFKQIFSNFCMRNVSPRMWSLSARPISSEQGHLFRWWQLAVSNNCYASQPSSYKVESSGGGCQNKRPFQIDESYSFGVHVINKNDRRRTTKRQLQLPHIAELLQRRGNQINRGSNIVVVVVIVVAVAVAAFLF